MNNEQKQIHHRFDEIEVILDQLRYDQSLRLRSGVQDIKQFLSVKERATAEMDPEKLAALHKPMEKHGAKLEAKLRNLKMGLLGCAIALGLTLASLGPLWFGQREITRQIRLRTPSSNQIDLMLLGWEQKKKTEVRHVQ